MLIYMKHIWKVDSRDQNKHYLLSYLLSYKQLKFVLNETRWKYCRDNGITETERSDYNLISKL